MSAEDETAKWYLSERIALAEAMARIEASLKNQDDRLDDLLQHAKATSGRMSKMDRAITSAHSRIRAHEAVAGVSATIAGLVLGVWQLITKS